MLLTLVAHSEGVHPTVWVTLISSIESSQGSFNREVLSTPC
jgi:hypothetical protein